MNWQSFYGGPVSAGVFGAATGFVLVVVVVWSLIWKGMALWKAARNESKPWFIVLLLVNSVGILDILYLYVFSKKSSKPAVEPPQM
jgi:hypothetical protein